MSIENGGPSPEEMGIKGEAEKKDVTVTGTASKDEISANYKSGRLTIFNTEAGKMQVYIDSMSGDTELTIKGEASGPGGEGEIELTYDTTTGKGMAKLAQGSESNPFA